MINIKELQQRVSWTKTVQSKGRERKKQQPLGGGWIKEGLGEEGGWGRGGPICQDYCHTFFTFCQDLWWVLSSFLIIFLSINVKLCLVLVDLCKVTWHPLCHLVQWHWQSSACPLNQTPDTAKLSFLWQSICGILLPSVRRKDQLKWTASRWNRVRACCCCGLARIQQSQWRILLIGCCRKWASQARCKWNMQSDLQCVSGLYIICLIYKLRFLLLMLLFLLLLFLFFCTALCKCNQYFAFNSWNINSWHSFKFQKELQFSVHYCEENVLVCFVLGLRLFYKNKTKNPDISVYFSSFFNRLSDLLS